MLGWRQRETGRAVSAAHRRLGHVPYRYQPQRRRRQNHHGDAPGRVLGAARRRGVNGGRGRGPERQRVGVGAAGEGAARLQRRVLAGGAGAGGGQGVRERRGGHAGTAAGGGVEASGGAVRHARGANHAGGRKYRDDHADGARHRGARRSGRVQGSAHYGEVVQPPRRAGAPEPGEARGAALQVGDPRQGRVRHGGAQGATGLRDQGQRRPRRLGGLRGGRQGGDRLSGAGYRGPSRDEDFGFLDEVGAPPRAETAPDLGPEPGLEQRRLVRTRNRARKSRRYNKRDYVQISGVVSREVKAQFDVALAREKVERGRGRKQFEVLESLMRFYAEEGDPYEMLEDGM